MNRKRPRRQANSTSWAHVIFGSQLFSDADATSIVIKVRVALQLLLDGNAGGEDFIRVGCAVNVASVRAEQIGDSAALLATLAQAGHALKDCERIHDVHGRYGLTGPNRIHLAAGIDAYEALLRASTPRQMHEAEQEVIRRLGLRSETA